MTYDLVGPYDPILKKPTEKFDFDNPPMDPKELYDNMVETLVKYKGGGLSCNQVGLPYSMFVLGHWSKPEEIMCVFNPKIVDFSEEMSYAEEGCLTYPGLFIKVKRPDNIRVRMAIENGITDTIKMDGIAARIFQHEYDHLQGVLYTQRANRFHVDQAKKQKIKLERLKKNGLKKTA